MTGNPMLWAGYPRSYTPGRVRPVQYVALHYTAGSEGPTSAESGAQYDKNRTDGTSCHAFFDSQGPGIQEVPFGDRSHSAYFYGNEIGVHFEICGTIQTRDQWLDPTSLATLRTCAEAVAYTCDTLGLARRRLTVDEVWAAYNNPAGSRPTGICDHAAITAAYGLGDHTDVGPGFPWDVFMQMVGGVNPSPGPLPPWPDEQEEEEMKLLAPQSGYGAGSVVLQYPTSLGLALQIIPIDGGHLPEAVAIYGQEKYVDNSGPYGTPIEELVKKWQAMGGPSGAGPAPAVAYTFTGEMQPK